METAVKYLFDGIFTHVKARKRDNQNTTNYFDKKKKNYDDYHAAPAEEIIKRI